MMNSATVKNRSWWALGVSCLLLLGIGDVNAQDKPTFTEDGYIFFIDGANVLIPNLDGSSSVDPLDATSDNVVYRINYGSWAESGFRWDEGDTDVGGVDMTALIGENYGESDTLYVRFLSDAANAALGGNAIAMFDTRTGLDYSTDNLPFRALWSIPAELSDGQWHDLAIPLPPATRASLDSAKAGKKLDGSALDVEVDSVMLHRWGYPGAWANGQGVFDPTDPEYEDFEWNAVAKFGFFWDNNGAGGPVYFDYYSIGVPPSELVDTPPSAAANVNAASANAVNTVTWDAVDGAGGYNVYFSESEITNVSADGVLLLSSLSADDARSVDHTLKAPHESLATDYAAFYAVTAKSPFGAESGPTSTNITSNIDVAENYAWELDQDGLDAVFEAISGNAFPSAETLAGFFPDSYVPFTINQDRNYIVGSSQPPADDDADLSGKFWVGFGSELNEFVLYAEIMDDTLRYAPVGASRNEGAGAAWDFDNYEMGLSNYSPESFIIGSTHTDILRGEAPDYQYRIGNFNGAEPFTFESWHVEGGAEIGGSQTITAPLVQGDDTVGYRLLTLYDTANLSNATNEDALFDFPGGEEVTVYPFNVAINDNDAVSRARQLSWSSKTGTADDWWNTPARWETVAFVGNGTATSNEDVNAGTPGKFALEQNFPNPFNPTTNIQFSLKNSTSVTLEVYNMLGQRVAILAQNKAMTSGVHSLSFDASALASGMYMYTLRTAEFVSTKKMMLVK